MVAMGGVSELRLCADPMVDVLRICKLRGHEVEVREEVGEKGTGTCRALGWVRTVASRTREGATLQDVLNSEL